MITLHRLERSAAASRLAGLRLGAGQERFVGSGAAMITDRTPRLSLHEVRSDDGAAVGMFKLDPLYHQRHDFAGPEDLGLRGFLIDAGVQGRGIGKAALAALPRHVQEEYPGFQRVVLTVNVENPVAYRAYLGGGFTDQGQLYLGGTHGPQHILLLDLRG